jgi:hypothetical protein
MSLPTAMLVLDAVVRAANQFPDNTWAGPAVVKDGWTLFGGAALLFLAAHFGKRVK